jgi:hypothetical protein
MSQQAEMISAILLFAPYGRDQTAIAASNACSILARFSASHAGQKGAVD